MNSRKLKVAIVNRSDLRGGAAVVSYRLMEALRAQGIDARMLVVEKLSNNRYVEKANTHFGGKIPFLAERLDIYLHNGRNRADLFKVDTAWQGIPIHRHPLVGEADVVCLNWVNQGMLSLREIECIAEMRKPIVWTMHDMWNMTGICHHAGECDGYTKNCGNCPLLGSSASVGDLSERVWRRKNKLYSRVHINFVAVSHWLLGKCRQSSLLTNADVRVIHNPFPIPEIFPAIAQQDEKIRLLIAAARLDDTVKGLPLLISAIDYIHNHHPEVADRLELIACGALKNPAALDSLAIPCRCLGLQSPEAMPRIYAESQLTISSSLYETLPGTLVEAQAYGSIPVAFDRGGQRDIIDDGENGILAQFAETAEQSAVNLAEAILRGIDIVKSVSRENLAKRLFDSVTTKFSAANVAKQYIKLFEECVK